MYIFCLIFRYQTSILMVIWENSFCDLVKGILIQITITWLLITLFEKFFHQYDPWDVLYLQKSNI